ncbi:hypothetical protein ACHAXA_000142 [Cyclostephanos tholiformis]|uniref:Serpin domain-containing protein n=1 Tax=Cyclostephanos tholiformis TaxID=382380 RepID=A0ABD3SC49_9STRA
MIGHHRPCAFTALVLLVALSTHRTPARAAVVDPADHQAFADDLAAILHTKSNECSSALGVSMAFSLVWPGCTGEEAIGQVRDVLGYPADSTNMQLVWDGTTQNMLAAASGQCLGSVWNGVCDSEAPLLKIANSVWFDDGDVLNATYDSVVDGYAMQTDFEAQESPAVVNRWVENSTNGMIDSIVDESEPLFPPYALIAINSIYLKASWSKQFDECLTNLDSFYDASSRTNIVSDAHFMNMVNYFDYSHDALSGYQVIDLPFDNSQMSMIFVIPNGDGVGAVQSTGLIGILDELESTRVALSLPKFKFESTYDDIKSALIQLGIVAPFTEGSGALCGMFDNISDCESLVIDDVIQKTVIDVNEKGVEAAAVTAVMVSLTSMEPDEPPPPDPILMILDHPFQFFVYDKEQELMLFEGRLGLPEVPETEPACPLLNSQHQDANFWSDTFGVNPIDPMKNLSSTTNSTATEMATSSPTLQPPDVQSKPPSDLSSSQHTLSPTIDATPTVVNIMTLAPSIVVTRPEEGTLSPMVETAPTVININTLFPTIVVTLPNDGKTTEFPIPIDTSLPQDEATTSSPVPTSPFRTQAAGNSAPKAMLVISYFSITGMLVSFLFLS